MVTAEEEKITQSELIELFGDRIPIEAAAVIFNAPDDWTVGQVRAEVRRIAREMKHDTKENT